MSTVLIPSSMGRVYAFALCALLLLLLQGCGTRHITFKDAGHGKEGTHGSYKNTQDTIPLSPTELKAFNSTGKLDAGLSTHDLEAVAVQYKLYLRQKRKSMKIDLQRAEKYLTYTRKVFRDRGLPEELAFLALVESGYAHKAQSHAGAAGAWQFMPYTGLKYGLNQDWWMDERLDPYKSTEAAAEYLAKLHGDFKQWHLAIAAYNAGEGKIGRALAGTGAKSFFDLVEKNEKLDEKARLRTETKEYVPRFLAMCKIMRNLESLGFTPVQMNQTPQVTRVQVRPGTDLMALAAAIGQTWGEFNENNSAHKRHVTHIDRNTYVYVPLRAESMTASFTGSGKGWKYIAVSKGDTWQKLSQRTTIPVITLQNANRTANLKPGSTLRIPAGPGLPAPPSHASPTKNTVQASLPVSRQPVAIMPEYEASGSLGGSSTPKQGKTTTYTVQAGDSLWGIARKHNIRPETLLTLNKRDGKKPLRPGDTLLISEP